MKQASVCRFLILNQPTLFVLIFWTTGQLLSVGINVILAGIVSFFFLTLLPRIMTSIHVPLLYFSKRIMGKKCNVLRLKPLISGSSFWRINVDVLEWQVPVKCSAFHSSIITCAAHADVD